MQRFLFFFFFLSQQSDLFFQKNGFPIYGISAPSFKIKTFLSTITHTQLILISKKSIFHYGFSFHFLVLLGTEVILSGGFLFVSFFFFLFCVLFFFLISFIFKLYIIVLVLPNIKMNPPQAYMCSPS